MAAGGMGEMECVEVLKSRTAELGTVIEVFAQVGYVVRRGEVPAADGSNVLQFGHGQTRTYAGRPFAAALASLLHSHLQAVNDLNQVESDPEEAVEPESSVTPEPSSLAATFCQNQLDDLTRVFCAGDTVVFRTFPRQSSVDRDVAGDNQVIQDICHVDDFPLPSGSSSLGEPLRFEREPTISRALAAPRRALCTVTTTGVVENVDVDGGTLRTCDYGNLAFDRRSVVVQPDAVQSERRRPLFSLVQRRATVYVNAYTDGDVDQPRPLTVISIRPTSKTFVSWGVIVQLSVGTTLPARVSSPAVGRAVLPLAALRWPKGEQKPRTWPDLLGYEVKNASFTWAQRDSTDPGLYRITSAHLAL